MDDGQRVITIAHPKLLLRWAKNPFHYIFLYVKLEMCQYYTDAYLQEPSSPGNKHFAKKKKKKNEVELEKQTTIAPRSR